MSVHRTQNLYEASFLLALGAKLTGKVQAGPKITLLFENPEAERLSLEFYNGGMVQAKAYAEAFKTLKDFIFAPR